jgi:hypothetical protein
MPFVIRSQCSFRKILRRNILQFFLPLSSLLFNPLDSSINMSPHTLWYPADEPESMHAPASHDHLAYPEDQPSSRSKVPFRLVAFSDDAPYPLDESQPTAEPSHMVDLWSGERFHRADSIRQPVAEDYLQPHRPLPPLPIKEYDSDQELPVIEPDTYLNGVHADDRYISQPERADEVNLGRRDTIATTRPMNMVKTRLVHKRSHSAINLSTRTSQEFDTPESQGTPIPVAAMGDDMFSPVLGGLHRISSAPTRRPSKIGRLKRFFSFKGR